MQVPIYIAKHTPGGGTAPAQSRFEGLCGNFLFHTGGILTGERQIFPNRFWLSRILTFFPALPACSRIFGDRHFSNVSLWHRDCSHVEAQVSVPLLQYSCASTVMDTAKLSLLRNAMSAYAKRRRTLSSNLANVDTPGYERTSVSFEKKLQAARDSPEIDAEEAGVKPTVDIEEGQNPILEEELMALSDTQMRTQLATRALSDHFELMRTGITGRAG